MSSLFLCRHSWRLVNFIALFKGATLVSIAFLYHFSVLYFIYLISAGLHCFLLSASSWFIFLTFFLVLHGLKLGHWFEIFLNLSFYSYKFILTLLLLLPISCHVSISIYLYIYIFFICLKIFSNIPCDFPFWLIGGLVGPGA